MTATATATMSDAQIVEQIVGDKISNQEMFTAHEIGEAAKAAGAQDHVRKLRMYVHGLYGGQQPGADGGYFAQLGYSRTTIDVGQAVTPWLYHPQGADISVYTNKLMNQPSANTASISTVSGIAQPAPAISQPDPIVQTAPAHVTPAPNKDSKKVVKEIDGTDADGRLFIGKDVLSKLGLKPGDKVRIAPAVPQGLAISFDAVGDGDYQVNADFRIRIGKTALQPLKSQTGFYRIYHVDDAKYPCLVVEAR